MKTLFLFAVVTLFVTGTLSTEAPPTVLDTNTTTTEQTTETPTTIETSTTTESPITEAPGTTTNATITSTVVPTTNEPPVTSTIPPPTSTKIPEPSDCPFNITQGDLTCIRADLKMSFIVSLEGKDSHINLGCNANYELSNCSSNETQTLVLSESTYTFTMVFGKEKDKFSVNEIVFEYNLPAGEGIVSSNTTKIFTVKTGSSYLCKTKSDIHLGNVTIEISTIHVQAFLQKDDKNFGSAEECEADDKVSDVVPIAVGVALAALIIVVLIAYLVGRRRSRQSGYQSV